MLLKRRKHLSKVTTIANNPNVFKQNNKYSNLLLLFLAFITVFVISKTIVSVLAAGDVDESWDFSNAGDYLLSNDSFIEVADSTAKLKVQNYDNEDPDTVALYHLDETSGTTAADSTSNSNDGTSTSAAWTTGNFNNAFDFDGVSSKITVSDTASISLPQINSLEAWTKFDNAFSAGSHSQHQGILDKASYQLYFDKETGKVTYELQSGTATDWTRSAGLSENGSWDLDGKLNVSAMNYLDTILYVGLGSGNGDAEVWAWDGADWSLVGGNGINSSWAAVTFESVFTLANDGTDLYAGLGITAGDGEVWKYTVASGTWAKIGGDAINSSWAVNTFEGVYSMVYTGGYLYAGLGNGASDAEVWRWNGTVWSKIGGDSLNSGWTTNYDIVYSLATDGTYIYAGLGLTANEAEVWRYSISGGTWTKIGGDTVNSSWDATNYEYVLSMTYMSGNLYAGIGISANEAEVWRWNGTSWTQIGGDSLNSGWTTNYEGVYSLVNDGTYVYAGLGVSGGDNELYRWNGTSWSKVGGDGVNGSFTSTTHTHVSAMAVDGSTIFTGITSSAVNRSGEVWSFNGTATWTRLGGNYYNHSWGFRGLRIVEAMATAGEKLYAGLGLTNSGNALVWEYDDTEWELVGGQNLNSSWAVDTYESVLSMVSHNGLLHVGLGITSNDAEVWRLNADQTWTQIGGDSLNSGWAAGFEEVASLASHNGILYAGIGNGANDAEVWSWNGSAWTKIGGDSLYSGWTTNFDRVASMTIYNGYLHVGLGLTQTEAEVWRWNNNNTWTKIGGDGLNSSWNTVYEQVDSLITYNGDLYAGVGQTTGEASIWKYNGSSWSMIAGDDVNGSWTSGTYERVRAMTVYNGNLYAGIGNTAGDAEVWEYNGSSWSQIGGDSFNSSWTNVVEEVASLASYRGKLYAGIGNTQNTDAGIFSYGNNSYLQSTTDDFDTAWHHIAATYNGSTMRIYIDGVLDSSKSANVSMPDNNKSLLIGTTYGGLAVGTSAGHFTGLLDEIRISDVARTTFNTSPYSSVAQTIQNSTAVFTADIGSYAGFVVDEDANGGTITYRLSDDNAATWKYWNGAAWVVSSSTAQANSATDVNTNIDDFPVTTAGIIWQAILSGNGNQEVTLNSVTVEANSDIIDPTPPSSYTALNISGGDTNISSGTWYSYTTPYFTWDGATDDGGADIAGYYVYFGTDDEAVPSTAGVFQAGTSYSASSLVSGSTYYLRIQTRDNAQNVSTIYAPFSYKFDSSPPNNPSAITVSPSGYASTNNFTFSWPSMGDGIATDSGSQVAGYQYKTGTDTGPLSDWSTITTNTSINIPDGAYQPNANTFYLRTVDNAGNISSLSLQATYYFAGEGPSEPQFLSVTPSTNTTNSFAFSWQIPATFNGDEEDLTYCYTVNTLPSAITCTYTSPGATSIAAGSFATQVGLNTVYVVARNGEEVGSTINYGAYASATFTANTSAPGIPLGLEISDVSIKNSEAWRLALSWTSPTDVGSGVSSYQLHRSTDDETYTLLASTTGAAYIDTSLDQQIYYYKIRACDSVNNCGAFTTAVSLLPTGRFTEAPSLVSDPEVTAVTTKRATITWSTDRTADSKIQFGKGSGDYFDEEPSNSDQVTAHTINLTNLSPGTKYYAVSKWTDEDGNTGVSDEYTFTTTAAPTVEDPQARSLGINSVTLSYKTKGASTVKIYYGLTSSFGGSLELSTSTAETTYLTTLDELLDGTKYFYKINTFDSEGDEYEGNILSFETLPRPRLTGVKIQQVRGSAQPAALVSWNSNTEVSSIVTYYPQGKPGDAKDEVNVTLKSGSHRMLLKGLLPDTPYTLIVRGRDRAGNEASSDPQTITTATDTRPPLITNLKVEGSINTSSEEGKSAQLIVSWDTDEPATSQVEFGEGTGTTYSQKSQEDSNLTFNHVVVISGLNTSKVYHLRALSKDKANNLAESIDTVSITPRTSDSALNLVISNLSEVFGFLGNIQ